MTVFGGDPTYASDINDILTALALVADAVVWVNGVGSTSSSSAIGATETVVLTLPSYTYKANTAYEFKLHGAVTASVATNSPLFRFRKTNTAGQQFDTARVACISTSAHGIDYSCTFQVGASDVTATLVVTLTGAAGFNATLVAAATSPSVCDINRIGAQGGIPSAIAAYAPTLV